MPLKVNPPKPQESKGSLEVAILDHLRTTTINHRQRNRGEEPEDVFEDDVADPNMKMMVKLRGEVVG